MIRLTKAFTLIELTITLLIAAILSGMTVWSLAGPRKYSQTTDVLDEISHFDTMTRQQAQRLGKSLELVVDVGGRRIIRSEMENDRRKETVLELAEGFEIRELRLGDQRFTHDRVTIPINAAGLSPTYAIEVYRSQSVSSGSTIEVAGNTSQSASSSTTSSDSNTSGGWWMVAGLTGQRLKLGGESDVDETFGLLAVRRDHTH